MSVCLVFLLVRRVIHRVTGCDEPGDEVSLSGAPSIKLPGVLLIAVGLLAGVSGCHLRPDLATPGTMDAQRVRSMQHDPYPSNELGPPVTGVRPRDFDLPRSEVTQLQSNPSARQGGVYVPGGF